MTSKSSLNVKPTYRSRHVRYEIDRCEPQNRAIESGKVLWHALTKGHYPGTLMPQNVLAGLSSIGFWDANGAPDWGEEPHRNEGIEIVFLETGAMAFTADGQQYNLRAGQFTITRPWQLHKLGAPNIGPGLLHWLILDVGVRRPHQNWRWPEWIVLTKSDLDDFTRKLRYNENPVWNATPAITESFRDIGTTVDAWNRPRAVSHLVTHLNRLFLNILEALSTQQTMDTPELTTHRRTVDLFLRELKGNLAASGEPWSKGGMAEHCGMSTTTFSKYCRELVNSGPIDYLNYCRLDHAAHLLHQTPDVSITEIAFTCGFNTSQYFATCFRRRFKCTPQIYRQNKQPVSF